MPLDRRYNMFRRDRKGIVIHPLLPPLNPILASLAFRALAAAFCTPTAGESAFSARLRLSVVSCELSISCAFIASRAALRCSKAAMSACVRVILVGERESMARCVGDAEMRDRGEVLLVLRV